MLRKFLQFGCLLAVVVLTAADGAHAQRRIVPLRPRANRVQPTPQERRMLDIPPAWVERLQGMTPEQQERFLNNNARVRNMPPQQQDQIRQRLQAFNRLTPEQQKDALNNARVWAQMTPEQQREVRQNLLPAWRNLAPARRKSLLGKLHDLRGLDDAQRAAKLNDEGFVAGLNPEDRQMLRDLSALRVGEQGPPGEF
jgi:hypothetical protein